MKRAFIIILVVAGLGACSESVEKKQAFIDNLKLYNEFQFTKDLEHQIKAQEDLRMGGLDSLEIQLKMLSKQIEIAGGQDQGQIRLFQYKQNEYQMRQEQAFKELEEMNAKFNEQIWTRLNEYVTTYGKEEGYQFIFGGMGEGNVMYCDSSMNITPTVIDYVNSRFSGGE